MRIKILLHQLVTLAVVSTVCGAALAEVQRPYVFAESSLTPRLSQEAARHVFQDSRGYIWVLTQEGLNRFDGKENKIFRADVNDPSSISHVGLRGVVEDASGNLWFGTGAGGLNRFIAENESFEIIRKDVDPATSPFSDRIMSMSAGLDNKIWIGYLEGGFSVFDPNTRLFKHYTGHRWPVISDHAVLRILEEADGSVWVATAGNGLLKLDLVADNIVKVGETSGSSFNLPSEKISDVYRCSSGNLWLSTSDAGVFRVNVANGVVTSIDRLQYPGDSETRRRVGEVHQVFEDQEGTIFFATDNGIGVFDDTSKSINLFDITGRGTSQPKVFSIIQDQTGRYWVGTYQGVFTGFKSFFYTLNANSGLGDENILSIAKTDDGSLWMGTASGLLQIPAGTDLGFSNVKVNYHLANSAVTALLPDGNMVWAGTYLDGLHRIDLKSGTDEKFVHEPNSAASLSSSRITELRRDSFGNLWVGTFDGGLNLLRAGSSEFIRYRHDPQDPTTLSSNTIYALYQERNGDLWVGTTTGLNRFNYDTGTFDRFLHDRDKPGSLGSHVVYALHEDSKSRLWIGTQGGGLNMWEPYDRKSSVENFKYFQTNIGLPSSNVWAIEGDASNNLWLATSGGLTRFNYEQSTSKNYTIDDGLQANDFNSGSSFRDREGFLYFGGARGLNVFYPEQIKDNETEPPMAITRISLVNDQIWFDRPYDKLKKLELGPNDYMLGFEFAALDFNAPDKNQYRYQMVGLHKNWIDLGNNNTVSFTNLPTGQFVFRVQGSNSDGVWNQSGVALDIVVHPPWYATWWAFFLYITAFLILVMYGLHRMREKEQMQMQYQATLESDVRARTRDLRRANDKLQTAVDEIGKARLEAVEANQAKSEFLAALSHEIRTPMHGVLGMTDLLLHSGLAERQQGFAVSAHESANELLGLIDNILDFSKIEAGKLELEETTFNLREISENLCYLYGELAQAKNIELNLIFNAKLRRQLYGDPVRLRQILQNLLSNAIKFTKRGSVTVIVDEVAREGKTVGIRFTVEDSGIGMDEETLQKIFEAFSQADSSTTRQYGGTGLGLSIAKQLIELMEGQLEVSSKPGVGTRMSVKLAMVESPIYTDKLSTSAFEDYYAEVVAPVPETRAMFRSQLEALSLQVRECSAVEELAPHSEHPGVVLVDVTSLYDNAGIAQVENLAADESTLVLLIKPLSLEGIPDALAHLNTTTKPTRLAGLINDILGAMSEDGAHGAEVGEQPIMRFNQRILLVEDMTANQEIARAMLESFGCSVAIAKDGDVALEMYQHDEFDIVLMDFQMPVMDGFEATRHIRQMETRTPGGFRMPIVALTAGKTEMEKERCYASGMDRILFKPYSTLELNGVLSQYFDPIGIVEAPKVERATPESGGEILDMKALDNIRNVELQTGNNLLEKVFENFKQDVVAKLDELRANHDDPQVLGSGAHAIKSMSLNIGAKSLSEYCRMRETDWKNQLISDARREIEVMHGHYLDAVRALEQVLETADADVVG